MKILTVHEPWAWSFFDFGNASKDIENRSQKIPRDYRGPLAIHVSRKQLSMNKLDEVDEFIARTVKCMHLSQLYRNERLRGHIIGVVDVINCVRDSPSRWAMPGYWHWVVANPRRVKPVPIVGQQWMLERELELEYP